MMTANELRTMRTRVESAKGGVDNSASVISRSELEAIRAVTTIKTTREKAEDKVMAVEQRDQQRLAAR